MKRRVLLITLFAIILGLFSFQSAFAADDDIASGNYNGVDWRITSEGELIIGAVGITQYMNKQDGESFPWTNTSTIRNQIKTARFKGRVIGQYFCFLFFNCKNLESINFNGLDTSEATDLQGMFGGCSSLKSLDLSGFNTSKVDDMSYMFSGCSSLKSLDLSGFNTSSLDIVEGMFNGCNALTSLDVTGLNTRNVYVLNEMFKNCYSLTDLDLSGFDLSKVGYATDMLSECNSLKSIKVPRYLNIDAELPCHMYDSECKEYTLLPKNLKSSKFLYKEPRHQWIEEITKQATCNAEGVKKFTCSNCGAIETTVIPKTSHSWDSGVIAKPAKYFSTGVRTYTCTICGATKSQVIPVKNVKAVTPARVKLSGAKVSGKKLTVKWKRIAKNTKGYQVSVKDRKTGKEKYYAVKQSSKATLKKTIKKLKKGRKYSVRVRAYNQIGDEIIYGPWSNVKSGKI